jgi:two-component system cell cycle sensor histidine kinase PleC
MISPETADHFETRAKLQAVRVTRKIIAVALVLSLCMWSFIGWSLWSEYSVARTVGKIRGFNLTAAFASELTMTLDSVSSVFRLIDVDTKASPSEIDMTRLRQSIDQIVGTGADVCIFGADGQLLSFTNPLDGHAVNVSQHAHFIAHLEHPASGLIIEPLSRNTADKAIKLSARLDTADGKFAGEAMLRLKPIQLVRLNREIDLGQRGRIVIIGNDGIVRAGFGHSHLDGLFGIGFNLNGGPYPADLPPGTAVTYFRRGAIEGVDRQITIRALKRYPLRVAVALDLDDVLGGARQHIWLISFLGVAANGLIAVLTILLFREVWRRTGREIELAYDRDQLQLAQEQIEADRARLAEVDRELQASKAMAETANRARGQFLAHMSHELRTPLHAIIGFSELIQDQAPAKPGAPPIAGYAADIWTSGRHLLELINAILDISKVESGTATLAETVFPVADLARASLVSIRGQAEAKNIQVDLRLPETMLRVRADRTRLLQVLINLMSNAVKFTPIGGQITLTAAVAASGNLVFSVADTGIGMTEQEIAIALEPFGQVDSTLSRSFEGTGLGLPLALKLTELHDGRLEVISVKGKGTTVNITLMSDRVMHREGGRVS